MRLMGTLIWIKEMSNRLLLITFCVINVTGGVDAISLAVDGHSKAVIVASENAPIPVQFAANELKHYLEQITGGEFHIVNETPANQAAIVLGADLAKAKGIDVMGLKRDGYLMRTHGEHLHVAGVDDTGERSSILYTLYDDALPEQTTSLAKAGVIGNSAWDFERGTLYGVYDVLERLGVCWPLPGPKGEIVPRQPTLRLGNLDIRQEPYFDLRAISRPIWPSENYVERDIVDPEEYHFLELNLRNQMLWFLRQRRSSTWMAFNHRPHRHQWAQRFSSEHPEYFALQKEGTRLTGERHGEKAYLNYTNHGVLKETLADIDAFFSKKPASTRGIKDDPKFALNNGWHSGASYGETFSLLPNDGLRIDYSEQSVAFLREDMALGYRHSDYVWQFVDKVARVVAGKWPKKKIICLAYQTYWEVPQDLKSLPNNVVVGVAALSGPSRLSNSVLESTYSYFMDLVGRWYALNKQPMLFWNYGLYRYKHPSRMGIPMLLPRHIARLTRDLSRYGRYLYMQFDQDNMVMEHLNVWVQYKLAWNPQLDVKKLLEEYASKVYGPSAKIMKALLDDIERHSMVIARTSADYVTIWEKHFTEGVMSDYRRLMDKAVAINTGTPYESFTRLMNERFLGVMQGAREHYVKNVLESSKSGAGIIKAGALLDLISIDGKMEERTWR